MMHGGLYTHGHCSPPAAVLLSFYVMQPENADPAAATMTRQFAFTLHSRPASTKKIFLDFDGHTATATAWSSGSIVTPPYDTVSQQHNSQRTAHF
jgi:hypothetical protein